ncbi:hypothetical protein [Actinomycetospora sp. TBRC 11914]|uniref:hypothetical protein n=1 Tax=Actinomycetospora sp. TBRC 11914 TaxID=2729387 RepID=UPI00145CF4C6|nr:hypothetical protein [Actinomycetospora sp. TBRC 11914]NMO92015.1 hypothetical protein [Actinomycetospora sp. TBRC 11914]
MTDEEMSHLLDDPLPEGMFAPAEEAIIVFARASTWMQPITDEMYKNLAEHFSTQQIMEISFTVGLDQMISRFHAAVRTDLDGVTAEATNACAVRIPGMPEA